MPNGRLTTHVLDTALGRPAAGLALRLYRLDEDDRRLLASAVTNADGRTDRPLLEGDEFGVGAYEIEFEAGDYHRAAGAARTGRSSALCRCGSAFRKPGPTTMCRCCSRPSAIRPIGAARL